MFSVPDIDNFFKVSGSSGDSIAIFIRWERLLSLRRFHSRVFISFICENLLSTEAVETGIDRLILASVFKLGNIVTSVSFVTNSFCRKVFHSVVTLLHHWKSVVPYF